MTTLKNKFVTIKKEQHCWGCAKRFPIGTRLQYVVAIDGRQFYSSYWCKECCDKYDSLKIEDGVSFGELAND